MRGGRDRQRRTRVAVASYRPGRLVSPSLAQVEDRDQVVCFYSGSQRRPSASLSKLIFNIERSIRRSYNTCWPGVGVPPRVQWVVRSLVVDTAPIHPVDDVQPPLDPSPWSSQKAGYRDGLDDIPTKKERASTCVPSEMRIYLTVPLSYKRDDGRREIRDHNTIATCESLRLYNDSLRPIRQM